MINMDLIKKIYIPLNINHFNFHVYKMMIEYKKYNIHMIYINWNVSMWK